MLMYIEMCVWCSTVRCTCENTVAKRGAEGSANSCQVKTKRIPERTILEGFFFCLQKINSSLNWEAGASKKSKKNMKTQFIVYGSCLRVQLKPKLVSTVVALWISSSIPNCTVDYNNQFPPFLLHLNDLKPMIHHTTHHNKHEQKKKATAGRTFFLHHIKVISSLCVRATPMRLCVGEHQFSIIISRFSRISRNIVFFLTRFFPRLCSLRKICFFDV